ncbi:hypothetical protein [Streptomyces physcomitrii]|uniref:Uncharacterized protein n=1 Tax=Streptomyces physcomitrii TaxID=2724184 RepID=A0ABX1HA60_9ACTN|nr:hypothetical protein [Streptomyces physcomitrii]NKI45276.1 hypothetical protein [Streptomyces physcomitrii]
MSGKHKDGDSGAEEVRKEIEDAETRVGVEDDEEQRRHDGEAGDATSPNPGAQQSAHEEDRRPRSEHD